MLGPIEFVSWEAANALGRLKDGHAARTLADAVENTRLLALPDTVSDILQLLAGIGPPAVPELIRLANHDDIYVRRKVAALLGASNDPRALSPLIAPLKAPSSDERAGAVVALGELGIRAAVPSLRRLLKDITIVTTGDGINDIVFPRLCDQAALAMRTLGYTAATLEASGYS